MTMNANSNLLDATNLISNDNFTQNHKHKSPQQSGSIQIQCCTSYQEMTLTNKNITKIKNYGK